MQFLRSHKGIAIVLFLVVSAIGTYLLLDSNLFVNATDYEEPIAIKEEFEIIEPTLMYGMVVDNLNVTEDVVKRNQRFTDLFADHYISPEIYQQLHFVPRSIFDFRKIAVNKKYTLLYHQDSLRTARALIYEPNAIDYVIFHLEDTLLVEICQREVITVEKSITGIIQSSLSETIENLGITHELTNRFVDIFAWQIDFQRLQRGDQFKLIYEENLVDGNPIGIGKINGIYFEHFIALSLRDLP